MTTIVTVTKNVIKRAWTDLEPKLITFLATGLTSSGILWAADYLGVKVDPALAAAIVVVVSTIAGYVKSSTTHLNVTAPAVPVSPAPVDVAAAPVEIPTVQATVTEAPVAPVA